MKYSDVPDGLKGLGITFITVGLMSTGIHGLLGNSTLTPSVLRKDRL